ncbi:MAG: RNA polymerase sporulation sigma factor SigK [Clostridia bacterium]|nr:RNA polymerase sporulation sigma factor SigK [Clostridia bacterium]
MFSNYIFSNRRKGRAIFAFIGYLNNSSFPHPLSEEEEKIYIDRLVKNDVEARNILIEHNLRLVAHITKKYENSGEDVEELISIGTMGLIKAINTFDPQKGTRLATYAARCIENEILMHLRAKKKQRSEVSLYNPIGIDKEGNEITLIDVLGTDTDTVVEAVENEFDQEKIRKYVSKLNERERNVIELRYGLINGLRKTQKEIAKRMGLSRSYISRIEKKAIQKLIKAIND